MTGMGDLGGGEFLSFDDAEMLGEALSKMDETWMTDTARAVALVTEWEMMKAARAAPSPDRSGEVIETTKIGSTEGESRNSPNP